MKHRCRWTLLILVAAVGGGACGARTDVENLVVPAGHLGGQIWADNWFAMYVGPTLVVEDSVPITTERSFNSEQFTFQASYPIQMNFILKDFKENDSGLEYIGKRNQQMGDGGFIGQFLDSEGQVVAVSDERFRCLVIHKAPRNKSCEKDPNPLETCESTTTEEPEGWKDAAFDDSLWSAAVVHDAADVRPKGGYDEIRSDSSARLIWTSDLEADNTLLCRLTVNAP